MGIKGIYGEIGPGKRVALSKLAVEKLEQKNRPLRIAIDISIWHFQTQAGKGGSNPAVRTLYYRLLRLLALSIQPIFVFDGSNKPKFKRNKRVGSNGASLPNFLAKQVIKFFGFPCHNAPGEAEAECALLQREGIVDAVLSEDVDTLMFGCGLTFRNWSSESHNGAPTHVSVYEAESTKAGKSGLDREGMVLVAMMSGGDYITEGIPGCGIKTACDAAKAGFGSELCMISKADEAGLQAWKQRLLHEIQTNESKFFKVKRKAFKIPENFPDKEVLSYYTNPVVSTPEKIARLKREITWNGDVDVISLRLFTAEAFEWTGKIGARKYIRGLAPALLVSKLLLRGNRRVSGLDDVILTAMDEMDLVRSITGKRAHFCTDSVVELRLSFMPNELVGLDLEAELDESEDYGRDGLAINPETDDMENIFSNEDDEPDNLTSPRKRGPSTYDPTVLDKVWVPKTIAMLGIPLKVEDYEESLRNPKKRVRKPAKPRAAIATKAIVQDMPRGALDKFVTTRKLGVSKTTHENPDDGLPDLNESMLRPTYLVPALENSSQIQPTTQKGPSRGITAHRSPPTKVRASVTRTTRSKATKKIELSSEVNPWSKSTSNSFASSSLVPVTRHTNDTAVPGPQKSFRVSNRISYSPKPKSSSQPAVAREISSLPRGSDTLDFSSNLQKTVSKRRSLTVTEWLVTPPNKKTMQSDAAIEHLEKPIASNTDIMLPYSAQKLNRVLFTPVLPDSKDRVRRESTSLLRLPSLDDVFSSPSKPGNSSTEPFTANSETETASSQNADREIILIDSSPPPSPIPLRRRNGPVLSESASSGNEQKKSPTKSNFNSSSNFPVLLEKERKQVRGRKRFLALRNSLEGSWKEVGEWDVEGRKGGVWGVDEVEVVDLSGD